MNRQRAVSSGAAVYRGGGGPGGGVWGTRVVVYGGVGRLLVPHRGTGPGQSPPLYTTVDHCSQPGTPLWTTVASTGHHYSQPGTPLQPARAKKKQPFLAKKSHFWQKNSHFWLKYGKN